MADNSSIIDKSEFNKEYPRKLNSRETFFDIWALQMVPNWLQEIVTTN